MGIIFNLLFDKFVLECVLWKLTKVAAIQTITCKNVCTLNMNVLLQLIRLTLESVYLGLRMNHKINKQAKSNRMGCMMENGVFPILIALLDCAIMSIIRLYCKWIFRMLRITKWSKTERTSAMWETKGMCARSAIIIGIISNAERDLDAQEMILLLILARLHCLWDRIAQRILSIWREEDPIVGKDACLEVIASKQMEITTTNVKPGLVLDNLFHLIISAHTPTMTTP